jgi:hypothetical protein
MAAIALLLIIAFKGALVSPPQVISVREFKQLTNSTKQISDQNRQISTLVQKLLTMSKVQAAPGREQAVGDAVAATAAGVAEGDARMKRAFELLKSGKLAEAESLLQAAAEEKERTLAAASKETAEAYIHLGAIAGLADPARAQLMGMPSTSIQVTERPFTGMDICNFWRAISAWLSATSIGY